MQKANREKPEMISEELMKQEKDKNVKAVIIFLVITFLLSSICYYIRIEGKDAAAGMTSILMWCPALAAFLVKGIFFRKEKVLGWNGCKGTYLAAGVWIPAVYLFVSYGAYWIFLPSSFTGKIGTTSIPTLLLLIPSALITAAGEEIGWRGFLLPKVAQIWNVKVAVILCGIIWSVWHMPLMIAGLYESGTVLWYQLLSFTLQTIVMTAILAYLRLNSKSVWPAIVLHGAHNYIDQLICGPLTHAHMQAYFVGETGFLTAIVMIIVTCFVWKSKFGGNL